ncbi:MAG: sodium:solute symporter, partial [Flavobacteriaceae bacterium]|nr:sodium:solute symporter [Flavobacteriaceae bacterium]
YAAKMGMDTPLMDGKEKTDLLFPEIAINGGLGIPLAIVFLLGLIAAAYSSADSALTSLTTSFSIDFLNIQDKDEVAQKKTRKMVHVFMSVLLIIVVVIFKYVLDGSVINKVLQIAGYTYGPLLGLFAFGIYSKRKIQDQYVWIIAITSVIVSYLITLIPSESLGGYQIGYELLLINGLFTFLGLLAISSKREASID